MHQERNSFDACVIEDIAGDTSLLLGTQSDVDSGSGSVTRSKCLARQAGVSIILLAFISCFVLWVFLVLWPTKPGVVFAKTAQNVFDSKVASLPALPLLAASTSQPNINNINLPVDACFTGPRYYCKNITDFNISATSPDASGCEKTTALNSYVFKDAAMVGGKLVSIQVTGNSSFQVRRCLQQPAAELIVGDGDSLELNFTIIDSVSSQPVRLNGFSFKLFDIQAGERTSFCTSDSNAQLMQTYVSQSTSLLSATSPFSGCADVYGSQQGSSSSPWPRLRNSLELFLVEVSKWTMTWQSDPGTYPGGHGSIWFGDLQSGSPDSSCNTASDNIPPPPPPPPPSPPFDCTFGSLTAGPLQMINYGGHSAIKVLDLGTGTYTEVCRIIRNSLVPSPQSFNACALNPKDKYAYCLARASRKVNFLVRISSTCQVEYVGYFGSFSSVSATFDSQGNFLITTNAGRAQMYQISGLDTYLGSAQGTLALPNLQNAPFYQAPRNNNCWGGSVDIVPATGKFGLPASHEYVAYLQSSNRGTVTTLHIMQIDGSPPSSWKCYKVPVQGVSGNTAYGAGWAYQGHVYFSANTGLGVVELDLNRSLDLSSLLPVYAYVVNRSEATNSNDGFNCMNVVTPFLQATSTTVTSVTSVTETATVSTTTTGTTMTDTATTVTLTMTSLTKTTTSLSTLTATSTTTITVTTTTVTATSTTTISTTTISITSTTSSTSTSKSTSTTTASTTTATPTSTLTTSATSVSGTVTTTVDHSLVVCTPIPVVKPTIKPFIGVFGATTPVPGGSTRRRSNIPLGVGIGVGVGVPLALGIGLGLGLGLATDTSTSTTSTTTVTWTWTDPQEFFGSRRVSSLRNKLSTRTPEDVAAGTDDDE